MELTMDQFGRIDAKLGTLIAEAGEMRTEQALACQRLGQIESHLARLNGRVGKNADRIAGLEQKEAERRGAWKLILVAASVPSGIIAAIAAWIASHK